MPFDSEKHISESDVLKFEVDARTSISDNILIKENNVFVND